MMLNNSELSTGLVYTLHGSAQSQGLPCSASFEKSPCLLAHTESQSERMVETTSKKGCSCPNFSTQCYQTYFSARERNTAGHETSVYHIPWSK